MGSSRCMSIENKILNAGTLIQYTIWIPVKYSVNYNIIFDITRHIYNILHKQHNNSAGIMLKDNTVLQISLDFRLTHCSLPKIKFVVNISFYWPPKLKVIKNWVQFLRCRLNSS